MPKIFAEDDEEDGSGQDAAPAAPFLFAGQDVFVVAERGGQGGAENQNADEGQHDAEHQREHARAHMGERAEVIGRGIERDRGAEQGHQPAGIEIALLQKRLRTKERPPRALPVP